MLITAHKNAAADANIPIKNCKKPNAVSPEGISAYGTGIRGNKRNINAIYNIMPAVIIRHIALPSYRISRLPANANNACVTAAGTPHR